MNQEDLAARFRALADPTRLVLLGVLLSEELTVGELAEVAETAQPGVSRHLAALRDAGLVAARRQGTMTFYRAHVQDGLLQGPVREAIESAVRDAGLSARIERVLERRKARSRAFFDETAAGWDELRAELFNDTAAFASLMPLLPRGLSVVDIGTGTGGMLSQLAQIADRVVGVDHSAKMLQHARDKARRLGLAHAEFVKGDIASLPLPDATFDAAFAVLVLHHAPKPADAVREMARVVRPGGHVIVVDLVAHGEEWLRSDQADLWLGFTRDEVESWLARAALFGPLFKVVSKAVSPRGGGSLELFVASATRPLNGTSSKETHHG